VATWLQWQWCHHVLLRNNIHKNLLPGWNTTCSDTNSGLSWKVLYTLKVLQNPCICRIWPQKALNLPYKEVTGLWGVARILHTGSMLSMKMTIYAQFNSELPWYRVRCVSLDRNGTALLSQGDQFLLLPALAILVALEHSLVGNSCTSLTLHESSLWLWSTVVR